MSIFFPSVIYHPDPKDKYNPTFAFLSDQENFGIPEALKAIEARQIRSLVILVNGQQIPSLEDGDDNDKFFGRKLTGLHRIRENSRKRGVWDWKYQIFNGESDFASTASLLHEDHRGSALILDVLNAKFEWEEPASDNQRALETLMELVKELLAAFRATRQESPPVFIGGYSRGGVFSLFLAEALKPWANLRAVATIDPVIAPWKEEDRLVVGWGVKKGESWSIIWRKKLTGAHLYSDVFPILKHPGVPCHNVFQRQAFLALNHVLEKPIGSAVENAKAPAPAAQWHVMPAGPETHCCQNDLSAHSHAEMVEKYAFWILDLARHYCPAR